MTQSERKEQQQAANRTAEQLIAAARNGQEGIFGKLLMKWTNGEMPRPLVLQTLKYMFEDAPEETRREGIEMVLVGSRSLFAGEGDMEHAGERVLSELSELPHADVAEAAAEALGYLQGMQAAREENIVAGDTKSLEEALRLEEDVGRSECPVSA